MYTGTPTFYLLPSHLNSKGFHYEPAFCGKQTDL